MKKFSLYPFINTEENSKGKIENAKISKILDHLYLGIIIKDSQEIIGKL